MVYNNNCSYPRTRRAKRITTQEYLQGEDASQSKAPPISTSRQNL